MPAQADDTPNYDDNDILASDAVPSVDAVLQQLFPMGEVVPPVEANLPAHDHLMRFGLFIEARMLNKRWTIDDIAAEVDIHPDDMTALLDGLLPDSLIDDALIERLASVIDYQPNLLRLVLGRPVIREQEASQPDMSDSLTEIFHRVTDLVDQLVQEVDEMVTRRFEEDVPPDLNKLAEHEYVLTQMQVFIARHRSDVSQYEQLLTELKAAEQRMASNRELSLNIRRLIHRIEMGVN